jgi:hypothetical protein
MKVRVHENADTAWARVGDLYPDPDMFSADQRESHIRYHERGAEDQPQLLEIEFGANVFVEPHSHDIAEIIYVVAGELHFGSRVLGPGSSVAIDRNAIYSFRSGPQGLKFLNFRPQGGARVSMD